MPVSSFGYVNRLKLLTLPFDAKRYGPPNPNRDLLTIFIVREWPNGHGGLLVFRNVRFAPLEGSSIHIEDGRNRKHQLLIEGGVKALPFLTGFTLSCPRDKDCC